MFFATDCFFLLRFLRDKKRRERKARPEVFTEGNAQITSIVIKTKKVQELNPAPFVF